MRFKMVHSNKKKKKKKNTKNLKCVTYTQPIPLPVSVVDDKQVLAVRGRDGGYTEDTLH